MLPPAVPTTEVMSGLPGLKEQGTNVGIMMQGWLSCLTISPSSVRLVACVTIICSLPHAA